MIKKLESMIWKSISESSYKNKKFINREILYKELDHIRNFRNRVFHYEKVINKDNYNEIFEEINEILGYFDEMIYKFALDINTK